MNIPVYTSKSLKIPIQNPTHGKAGWRLNDSNVLESLTYCNSDQTRWLSDWKNSCWLTTAEYRAQKERLRLRKMEYYRVNPELIR
ncbi:MAG: hypothetical protein JWO00_70 [Candidatus Parcubacteria bacterium]|nr:hypothetical protein [Candidatus Parcubacteria bacterium]